MSEVLKEIGLAPENKKQIEKSFTIRSGITTPASHLKEGNAQHEHFKRKKGH